MSTGGSDSAHPEPQTINEPPQPQPEHHGNDDCGLLGHLIGNGGFGGGELIDISTQHGLDVDVLDTVHVHIGLGLDADHHC